MNQRIRPHTFEGVFTDGKNLYTQNSAHGIRVYGERLIYSSFGEKKTEFRRWDPRRSKFAAYLQRKGRSFPFKQGTAVLYLGAASGTTVSHLSDVVGSIGCIYAVEFARQPFQKLLFLAESRRNIIPIMEDANYPERYSRIVMPVETIYQDIAQRNQMQIFKKNLCFLKRDGIGILMVKARSIDVTVEPEILYRKLESDFAGSGYRVIDRRTLEPYENDHAAIVVRRN